MKAAFWLYLIINYWNKTRILYLSFRSETNGGIELKVSWVSLDDFYFVGAAAWLWAERRVSEAYCRVTERHTG